MECGGAHGARRRAIDPVRSHERGLQHCAQRGGDDVSAKRARSGDPREFLEVPSGCRAHECQCPQVKTPKQLLNLTKDGSLWTVGGKGIAVTEDADGSIRLTSDDGVDSMTVQEARPTDPTVTLIPLEDAVIVDEDVGNTILSMCFGEEPSQSSTAAPSSVSLPPSELSFEDSHAASSKESATQVASFESATQVASFRSLWELLF
ncbi:hypothetical protein CBR_g34529 [Chara braunii]|uniref:Uncharacterized protein n=1 Tax=Chara braunii TaxID=69332 RepID=A0A388LIU6_CHABU|nr:hypothetical protein CBR_g34529 [Chara braunii]|eukprot:GBG82246.1 hypothetical protein CBR_g34529 [Chara braunii]